MDVKQTTGDYVSKYTELLNTLHSDTNALAPLKVSILHKYMNENESTSMENHCQYCLTPWKLGNFVLKTHSKHQNKISILKKKNPPKKLFFTVVVKCLMCFKVTNSMFKKNKILNYKSVEKISNKSTVVENISETLTIQKNTIDSTDKKKSKKKKRNLYAGLNPLVFKNREINKTKLEKPKS